MFLLKNCLRKSGMLGFAVVSGCSSAPRVQLSAADSMDLLASSLATTIDEYRHDLDQLDDQRRKAVVDAFVVRVRTDHQDEEVIAAHTAAFTTALDHIEADRRAASDRRQVAMENLETLKEIADSLRRVAMQSMNLDDEARRYLAGVIQRRHAEQSEASPTPEVRRRVGDSSLRSE